MFEDQLDFTSKYNQEYFIFNNLDKKNLALADNHHYYNDLKNYQIEGHVTNEINNIDNTPTDLYEEQLEFSGKKEIHIFPQFKPIPLIYDSNFDKKSKSKKKVQNYANFNKNFGHKFKKVLIKSNPNLETSNKNMVMSNSKGLFDPNLKRNELDFPKKATEERKERLQKIKNYDLKFGNKLKKIEVYSNYIDMLEDVENTKLGNDVERENYKVKEVKKLKQEIQSRMENLPKPNYKKNNLNFDFSNHEEIIKSLEEQIENERRMRAEVRLQYEQDMKRYDNLKNVQGIEKDSNGLSKPKHLGNYKKKKSAINTFKIKRKKIFGALNKRSAGPFKSYHTNNKPKHSFFPSRRNNSADIIKSKMENLKPVLSNIIDKSFHSMLKDIKKKENTESKNISNYETDNPTNKFRKSSSTNYKSRMAKEHEQNNKYNSKNIQANSNINECQTEGLYETRSSININDNPMQNLNEIQKYNLNSSPMCNIESPSHFISHPGNQNEYKNDPTKTSNNYSQRNTLLFNKHTREANFDNENKIEVLYSLNKQIDNYSKGLPKLIDKVEETLNKISKINIFDERTHPIIKMASKHSGHILQLHIDEICDGLVNDLLFECVDELEEIEEVQKKREEIESFKGFLGDYYKDFELMRNFENDTSKKLLRKNYPVSANKNNSLNKNEEKENVFIYENPFNYDLDINPINRVGNLEKPNQNKQNPNIFMSNEIFISNVKRKYSTKIHPGFIKNIENYSKEYFDYMKTTGTFLLPNIFNVYDEIVKGFVEEYLNEELNFCVKQLDSFVSEFYNDEVLKN